MLTLLSFVRAAVHVIAVVTHAFGIVFLVGMRTIGDALDFLFSEHAFVHFLTFQKLLSMHEIIHLNRSLIAIDDRDLRLFLKGDPLT